MGAWWSEGESETARRRKTVRLAAETRSIPRRTECSSESSLRLLVEDENDDAFMEPDDMSSRRVRMNRE